MMANSMLPPRGQHDARCAQQIAGTTDDALASPAAGAAVGIPDRAALTTMIAAVLFLPLRVRGGEVGERPQFS